MIRMFLYWLTARLPARAIKGDNDEPYLERYYLFGMFGLKAYIHRFVASDPDRGLHDHPWDWSCSLILSGFYNEIRQQGKYKTARILRAGKFNLIRGNDCHRITLPAGYEAWTLFVHGRRTKGWGFWRNASYTPFATHASDYPQSQWWKVAPSGRQLRKRERLS